MSDHTPPGGFRTFLILWATQSVSVIGTVVTYFATTIWMAKVPFPRPEQKPELAWALSAMGIALMLPFIVGGPIAGAWADRHDRKRTMIAMDAASGTLCFVWIGLLFTHHMPLWLLIGLMAIFALLGTFHYAAFESSYAMLVPPDQLPRANGMMQTTYSLSNIIGPGLAAGLFALPALARQGHLPELVRSFLVRQDGLALVVVVDALTFFFAALVPTFLHVPSPRRLDLEDETVPPKTIWHDIQEGARYIRLRPPLLWLLATFTVANLTLAPIDVFMPLLIRFNLAADWQPRGFSFETALALLVTVFGGGGIVGGAIISAWGGLRKRRAYGVILPLLVVALTLPMMGLSPWLYGAAAAAGVAGIANPFLNAHSQAIWQNQTPREMQGRVFSVRRLIGMCTMPVGTALAGWAGGRFDPGVVLTVLGVVLTIFCVGQMFNPYLLRVDDKEWLDAIADRASAATH